jgi:hypothetical protein
MCLIILGLVRNLLRALIYFGAGVTLKGRISPITKTLGDLGAGGYKPWQYFWYQALIRSKECGRMSRTVREQADENGCQSIKQGLLGV